jgi:PST family polysaccharide transporter
MVKFVREISFRQAFKAELTGKLVAAGFSVYLARHGGGYWAVVANSAIFPLVTTSLSYVLAPYRPAISFARFSDFSGFVGWLSSAQLLAAAGWQVDRGVLGYFVTKATLGRYIVASDFSILPSQSLVGPALQPVMAAFARIGDDRERLANAYLRATQYAMMVAAPAGVGLSLTSDLIVKVLLGPKWLEAIFYLKWLALAAVLSAFYQPLYVLAVAINRPVIIFRTTLVEICCKVLLVALGYTLYQLPGVLAARGAVSAIMFVVVLLTARKITGIAAVAQLTNLWRVALSSAVMAALVTLLLGELATVNLNDGVKLGLAAASGAAIYMGALFGLGFRVRELARGRGAASRAFGV